MGNWTKVKYMKDHEGYRPKHNEGWGYCDACNLPTCLRRFRGPDAENPFYDYLREIDKKAELTKMNEHHSKPPINVGDRVLYDDSDREAVVLVYRPYPKPCYGVEGNVPSPASEYLYLTGPDGIARMYFVRWVPEDKLKPFCKVQKATTGSENLWHLRR